MACLGDAHTLIVDGVLRMFEPGNVKLMASQ